MRAQRRAPSWSAGWCLLTTLACLLLTSSIAFATSPSQALRGGLRARPLEKAPAGAVAPMPRRLPLADARGLTTTGGRLLQAPTGAPLTAPWDPVLGELVFEDVARSFVEQELNPPGELVWTGTVLGGGDVRHVSFQQAFGRVPVLRGTVDVAVLPDGSILTARVGDLAARGPRRWSGAERLEGPRLARTAAVRAVGSERHLNDENEIEGWPAEYLLVATARGAEPAWRVRTDGIAGAHEVVLRALDGAVLQRSRLGHDVARGHVFTVDPNAPRTWVDFPHPVERPSVSSPAGWCLADTSVGNNALVQLDREGDLATTPGVSAVATGDPLSFDFPFTDPSGDPQADIGLALANATWAVNHAHDRFYRAGFDEASGALQESNFGRGGVAGDPLAVYVQYQSVDGTIANNGAQMNGGADDGDAMYLTLGLFDTPEGVRDSALDADVVIHEYAHAVVDRLLGDGSCTNGIQPSALSEGWADFFAASFTDDPVIGAWVSANNTTGLRRRSLDDSNLTYFNLCLDGCNANDDGEIWSKALWDMRAALVAKHGQQEGVARAERLAVEGLRMTPCQPTFLHARDAVLLADRALHDGEDHCEVWEAFRLRQMGPAATTTGPADQFPFAAADIPPQCDGSVGVLFDRVEYGVNADAVIEVVDANDPASPTVTIDSSGGDSITVAVQAVRTSSALHRAPFAIEEAAVDTGDDVLQVADGDVLTATYLTETAEANVSGVARLSIDEHEIWGNCPPWPEPDDDHPPGWWILPGFLDAGEVADLWVSITNSTLGDLVEAEVRVSSTNPRVTVLPSTPIQLGTIRGSGGGLAPTFEIEVTAEADSSVAAGEAAAIVIDVTSRGRQGTAVLDLTLNMDYVVEENQSVFDGGVETFDVGSSTVAQWMHAPDRGTDDFWSLSACAGTAGTTGYANSGPACAPYVEGQIATTLLSPPVIPLPPDAVAYRFVAIDWMQDVDLWTDAVSLYCDADVVSTYFTLDPATIPFDDPFMVINQLSFYAALFTENTTGFERGGPQFFNTGPQPVDPAIPYPDARVGFTFFGDVVDCGFETENTGHYFLDDFRFTYDQVRAVPETAPCAIDCAMHATLEVDPPGPKCTGEQFTLRAAVEAVDCAGDIYFSFAGPGVPPEAGWTTSLETMVTAEDGGAYTLYAQCDTNTDCDYWLPMQLPITGSPGIGGVSPGTLRVMKDRSDVVFSWVGGAAPAAYGIYRAETRAELAAGMAGWPMHAGVDGHDGPNGEASHRDTLLAAEPGLTFLQVAGRDPCTDVPRVP